ncbi:MAG: hypothetical protein WDM78_02005 [Puia sp.]
MNTGQNPPVMNSKEGLSKSTISVPYIQLHMTRCILCYRCVYVADQLTTKREHGILDRGDHSEIATYIHKALESDFIGNVIDVCPVGALTDKTFRV